LSRSGQPAPKWRAAGRRSYGRGLKRAVEGRLRIIGDGRRTGLSAGLLQRQHRALGEPVALGHVGDGEALGARRGLELVGEIAHQVDPLLRIFAGKRDEDGGEVGEAMGARVSGWSAPSQPNFVDRYYGRALKTAAQSRILRLAAKRSRSGSERQ
jgi:hypothetical protein